MRREALLAAFLSAAVACTSGPVPPARLDTRNELCSWCRMAVSDPRFASQVVAPLEEPKFFDDLGCLRDYLNGGARVSPKAIVYVADHGTRTWIVATHAVYSKVPGLATPMASGLVAHADAASRAADPDAAWGGELSAADVFGTNLRPRGTP